MHKEYWNTECNADLLTVDYVAGNGSHSLRCRLLGIIALLLASLNNATASRIETIDTDLEYLISQKISYFGQLVKAYRYQDIAGTHALVMSRQLSPSSSGKNKTRLERIDLIAAHYTLRDGTWHEEWSVKDFVDCLGLDSSASFHVDYVTFSDLDNNGIAEVTLPYRTFCGGAIEPATVKIILRQGRTKLAIRGESLIRLPNGESFGGERKLDAALETPENALFRKHMNAVWQSIHVKKN